MKENESSEKSIHFLINSLAVGGAERVLTRLLPYLRVRNIFLLEKNVEYHLDKRKINFLSNHTLKTGSIHKTFYIPLYAKKLASKINKSDIVISFLERANFVNILSKFLKYHKTIISVRTNQTESYKGLKKFNKLLSKVLYQKADFIVAVSYGVKSSIEKLGIPKEKIRVIYNPCPIYEIQERTQENLEEIFLKFPYLITVGRLAEPKGQWYLLRIYRELKKKFSDLKLLILGDGELKEYLTKLSEDLGLKTYVWDRDKLSEDFDVYFLGFKKNPFKYIAHSEIFILPSLWEGFPNALIEAMACGVPVVSADCRSGPREILAPNTDFSYQTDKAEFADYGILLPPFVAELKKANEPLSKKERIWIDVLENFLQDKELREKYSERALDRAKDFRLEKIVKDWKKLLKEV